MLYQKHFHVTPLKNGFEAESEPYNIDKAVYLH